MNHLAHLFLADGTAGSIIGNLAGDFVKGSLGDRFGSEIRAGIVQHRRVDAFTDSHPSVAAFRRVLFPELGHNARVVSDVFYDHFLACDFERWSGGTTLDDFVSGVYAVLDQHADVLPGRLTYVYPFLRRDDWLRSYRSVEGIHTALFHLSKRLSRHPRLEEATHFLADRRGELEQRFGELFADLVAYIRSGAKHS